jgi:hypothetical protein
MKRISALKVFSCSAMTVARALIFGFVAAESFATMGLSVQADTAPLYQISTAELFDEDAEAIAPPPVARMTERHWMVALFELPLLALPLVVLFIHPVFRRFWGELKPWLRYSILAFFGCTIWFQATTLIQYNYPHRHEAFPFSRWSMFKGTRTSKANVELIDFSIHSKSGEVTVVNPSLLIRTPPVSAQHTKVSMLVRLLGGKDATSREFARYDLGYFCEALARSYESQTGKPVGTVSLSKRVVPWETPLAGVPPRGDPAHSVLVFRLNRNEGSAL